MDNASGGSVTDMGYKNLFFLIVFSVLFVTTAAAQGQRTIQSLASDADVRDSLTTFQSIRTDNVRYDARSGVVRAEYRLPEASRSYSNADAAIQDFVRQRANDYGWRGDMSDLVQVSTRLTPHSRHVLYQQVVNDIPVFGRYVRVNLSGDYHPTLIISGFDPSLDNTLLSGSTRTVRDEADLAARIKALYGTGSTVHSIDFNLIENNSSLQEVWIAVVSVDDVAGEWQVLVSAETGGVLHQFNNAFHRKLNELDLGSSNMDHERWKTTRASDNHQLNEMLVDGVGLVFDPDPLSSSGSSYTPPFVDNGDNDIPEVNGQRVSVVLPEITLRGGSHYLEGPNVKIVGGGSLAYVPPAEADATAFQYVRSSQHFEAVNSYYHIDKSQRYIQDLGFTNIASSGVSVNPRAFSSDNSVYSPSQNLIQYGIGGVDDGEDAGVVWHEYGHAIMESSVAGLIETSEGQALHEGWSDYWAGSYLRSLVESGSSARTDWQTLFKWDSGDGQIWAGRTIEAEGTYPEDTRCEDVNDSNGDGCNIYQDGLLWATTLMQIYDDLGREVTDQLNLQSHAYLSRPATFTDAAEALIQADLDLFDGAHTAVLLNYLGNRGYLNESEYGPVIVHDELSDTEQLGGTRQIEVTVTQASAALDSVILWYGVNAPTESLLLSLDSDDRYVGNIPLPSDPSTISYYVEAVDLARQRTILPTTAPQLPFSFDVGPDLIPPIIIHDPIESASIVLWPPMVVAKIEDDLGVQSALVDYELRNESGGIVESSSFPLGQADSLYQGPFPISSSLVQSGYSINYRIVATDASVGANQQTVPGSGFYSFDIVSQGLLAAFDFENSSGGFTPTGDWDRGAPAFGLQFAHSVDNVWGTNLDDQYSTVPGVATLTMPDLNLSGLSTAYLVLWHWYDYETEGTVTPFDVPSNATIWDGGNVKISTDGGNSWNTLAPQDGYTGQLEGGSPNPLANESGFGGYSYGWRQDIFSLPTGATVRIRFESGTDNLNTEQARFFAGWYIDDIEIRSDIEVDTVDPVVTNLPEGLTPLNVADDAERVVLTLSDNVGIARAQLKVDQAQSSVSVGDVLLEQDPADATIYSGQFAQVADPIPGDRIVYTLEVEDFDGNIVTDDNGGASYVVEYRTFLTANILADPVASGLWRSDGSTWIADGSGLLVARSGLIVDPITIPVNTDVVLLSLTHSYNLLTGVGGNVKITTDAGATWTVLEPLIGYPGLFDDVSHPMGGESVYLGTTTGLQEVKFDLSEYLGEEIRLKLDLGAQRAMDFSEGWTVESMAVLATTIYNDAEITFELSLTTNFPEPFSETTNLTYTVPEVEVVKVSIYDLLGRRVKVPVFSEHQPGVYTLQISGAELAAGMYMVVLQAPSGVRSEAITVIH